MFFVRSPNGILTSVPYTSNWDVGIIYINTNDDISVWPLQGQLYSRKFDYITLEINSRQLKGIHGIIKPWNTLI